MPCGDQVVIDFLTGATHVARSTHSDSEGQILRRKHAIFVCFFLPRQRFPERLIVNRSPFLGSAVTTFTTHPVRQVRPEWFDILEGFRWVDGVACQTLRVLVSKGGCFA
jgi:hypothetical protein